MPAWGVLSGVGALNAQSIRDLVNYVESIGTTSDKAKALAVKDVNDLTKVMDDPAVAAAADDWVAETTAAVAAAQADVDARGPNAHWEPLDDKTGEQATTTGRTSPTRRRTRPPPSSGSRPSRTPPTARSCS